MQVFKIRTKRTSSRSSLRKRRETMELPVQWHFLLTFFIQSLQSDAIHISLYKWPVTIQFPSNELTQTLTRTSHMLIYLTLGSDAHVTRNWGPWLVAWFLDWHVGQSIFSKYTASVQISCHETALSCQCLVNSMKHFECNQVWSWTSGTRHFRVRAVVRALAFHQCGPRSSSTLGGTLVGEFVGSVLCSESFFHRILALIKN